MENEAKAGLYQEANYAKAMIDSLAGQIMRLESAAQEIATTLAVLKEDRIGESGQVQVSIGSGVFVNVHGLDFDKVLFPMGSGVLKEEPRDKAREKLESNLKEIQESLDNLYVRKKDLETRYESILTYLQDSGKRETGTGHA